MTTTVVDDGAPTEWKKYSTYYVEVDPNQDDKSKEIKLCSFRRPHMRAFHCCWWSFFIAFCVWFALSALLPEIKKTLKLSKQQVWTSNIISVAGTIFMRFLLGPLCDKFGGRALMCMIIMLASIPLALNGLVQSASGLYINRLFIGIAGGSFVMCQFWTSRMFCKDVVGTANALVAGWGNLGGGVIQLVVGSALFPLFKLFFDGDAEKAWRTVTIVPAAVGFLTGIIVYFNADDAPKGNYHEMKKHGVLQQVSAAASFRRGAVNFNSWLCFFQYAGCFGVELTMNNASALYFKEEFGQSTESAAAIASIFGWMNLFARGLGGFCSDYMNTKMGMKGRILIHAVFLCAEGAMVLVFSQTKSLGGAIFVLIIFSTFVQAAEGSTFGIVPYIDPPATGSVSGIVGAGGNCGAVGFGLAFRQLNYEQAFNIMGFTIFASGLSCALINIKGHAMLFCGEDSPVNSGLKSQTLEIPEKQDDKEDA